MISLCEQLTKAIVENKKGKPIKIKSGTVALDFDDQKPIKLPAGTYREIGQDELSGKMIISNSSDDLFLI